MFNPPHFKNQPRKPPQVVKNIARMKGDKLRKTLQCWGCGEDHFFRNYMHQNDIAKEVPNVQESESLVQVARKTPRICVALEDFQSYNQSIMV